MAKKKPPEERDSVIQQTQVERMQAHPTRIRLFQELGSLLRRPVITYFTSFAYPVSIDDADVGVLEGVLRQSNLKNGLALMISSGGGSGLAAERIVNLCRSYSGTGEFWTIVPAKAKSAATMICFGSSKILMGPGSELGPVDPQIIRVDAKGGWRQFSIYNVVKSYDRLFDRAVNANGNLEPFLQQLDHYDEREIEEMRSHLELTDDYAVKTLQSGMMNNKSVDVIRKKVSAFVAPEEKKVHGRPIFRDEAAKCGLKIQKVNEQSRLWGAIYELYVRTDTLVQTRASKCIESSRDSFSVSAPSEDD